MTKKTKINELQELPEISLQAETARTTPNRKNIALDTLVRYSGSDLKDFQQFILLTNFPYYIDAFAEATDAKITAGPVLKVAHSAKHQMTIIDYRVGAPMAALVIDALSFTNPQAVLMLGLCGGLHRYHKIGDFLLPMAAIRDEGASRHYMPSQVPSLPAFMVQRFVSQILQEKSVDFKTGVIHTTDYRMWEFDEAFKQRLKEEKASAIDMECSALFTAGFARKVPVGALMLISDLPTQQGGIKTHRSAQKVISQFTEIHLQCGIDSLTSMRQAHEKEALNFRRFHFQ